jgi:cytochrome c oxidase subunit 2
MGAVNLAADYGWGPYTLVYIFIIVVCVTAGGILISMLTTKMREQSALSKRQYRFETWWAIGTAIVLVWLWVISYNWMPPVAFSAVASTPESSIQVVNVTAGQWFWLMNKVSQGPLQPGNSSQVVLTAGEPVKFIAHSVDVNHGFGVFAGPSDGAPILFQMQVIPKLDNVFYYTFKQPGVYMVRCLEYCGYSHPYMTSSITVIPQVAGTNTNSTSSSKTIVVPTSAPASNLPSPNGLIFAESRAGSHVLSALYPPALAGMTHLPNMVKGGLS